MMDQLQENIEDFNNTSDDAKGAASGADSSAVGTRNVNSISAKAKAFNNDLTNLQQKLQAMQDISYDKSKLDVVFNFTERALEQGDHLNIICERLKVLEQMH